MGPEPEAMQAALCQTYAPRDPLREFARGEIRLNDLRILIQHLPPDSALHRALPQMQGWRPADYLLAEVINVGRYQAALFSAANSADGHFAEPEWVETPQSAHQRALEEAERAARMDDVRAWLVDIEQQLE